MAYSPRFYALQSGTTSTQSIDAYLLIVVLDATPGSTLTGVPGAANTLNISINLPPPLSTAGAALQTIGLAWPCLQGNIIIYVSITNPTTGDVVTTPVTIGSTVLTAGAVSYPKPPIVLDNLLF